MENTANFAGSPSSGVSETSNEEDVTFFMHVCSDQFSDGKWQLLTLQSVSLPPDVSYPVWLPPDNS